MRYFALLTRIDDLNIGDTAVGEVGDAIRVRRIYVTSVGYMRIK